jgi:hypothetical protein
MKRFFTKLSVFMIGLLLIRFYMTYPYNDITLRIVMDNLVLPISFWFLGFSTNAEIKNGKNPH